MKQGLWACPQVQNGVDAGALALLKAPYLQVGGGALLALPGEIEEAGLSVVQEQQPGGGGGAIKQQTEVAALPLWNEAGALVIQAHESAIDTEVNAILPDL